MPIKGLNEDPLSSDTVRAVRAGLGVTANELSEQIAVTPRTIYAWETQWVVTYEDQKGKKHEDVIDPDPVDIFKKSPKEPDGSGGERLNNVLKEEGDKRACTGPARVLLQRMSESIKREDLPDDLRHLWE